MKRFNQKGMLVFPNPLKKNKICSQEELVVIQDCFCPNGHSLMSEKTFFSEFKGILLKISNEKDTGKVALSPVIGCKNHISIDIELKENELYKLSCLDCNTPLPIFTRCHCGGEIFTMFLNDDADYNSFIGACNRIGCHNSIIQKGENLVMNARLDTL